MLLKPLKCPKCGSPIKGKELDLMLQCPACGSIQFFNRKTKNIEPVTYTIIAPTTEGKGTLIYIPFWTVHAVLNVANEDISGGGIRRVVSGKHQLRGERSFYVCATEAIPEEVSRMWNMDLSISQPQLKEQSDFRNATRITMTMDEPVARSAAEFLFLRYETELPGTLQELDYEFVIKDTAIVYLPAWKEGTAYTLAL